MNLLYKTYNRRGGIILSENVSTFFFILLPLKIVVITNCQISTRGWTHRSVRWSQVMSFHAKI